MATLTKRIQQGVRALLAFATPVDLQLAQQYLSPHELKAFQQMARAEQLHSLNVLRDVLMQSSTTPHGLAVAALLHDVGKSRYHLAVWQKTMTVLVEKFLPGYASRFADAERLTFWTAPFAVRKHHPDWSVEILRRCQSTETAIWLTEHHQDSRETYRHHPHYALLERLQEADDAN